MGHVPKSGSFSGAAKPNAIFSAMTTDGSSKPSWAHRKGKTISFQDEEIARIENYAETLGLDFSDFVRTAALDAITVAVDETDED